MTATTLPRHGVDAKPVQQAGRRRAVVEGLEPIVDGGLFPIKRVVGEPVVVEADAFADGHDLVAVALRHRPPGETDWREVPMTSLGADRWAATFVVDRPGRHAYTVAARTDPWSTWRHDLEARLAAGQDVSVDLEIGAALIAGAAGRAADGGRSGEADRTVLAKAAAELRSDRPLSARSRAALEPALDALVTGHPDLRDEAVHPPLEVVVEPVLARFSSWYELFPRSASPDPDRPGTLRDVIDRLDYVADLGFDVLYLPPIHPIGRAFRKGPNNVERGGPDDPGVPWAIGGPEGGHMSVHPELGTLADVDDLVAAAEARSIAVALDLAFQASPDHPAVREHPDWFRQRPDGTIQYAENPPKKYEDIYPFDFESEDWAGLWQHLRDVVEFWVGHGIHVFRVDNPHTKPFPFWAWLIEDVKRGHPEVLFLAEAFTRPKLMYRLAKVGFSQSYTYFTWRTTADSLRRYFEELNAPPVSEFFRPNVWPNTPDILHETLQFGGRPAFQARLVLAATLGASYGIYGPPFELGERTPREAGSEEYLDSEKYQVRHWDLERTDSLAPLIRDVNRIRREHPALQTNVGLAFHPSGDDDVLAYTKRDPAGDDLILTVVSLDPERPRSGTLELPLADLGLDPDRPFQAIDLLDGAVAVWHGPRQPIELDPATRPAAIYQLRAGLRTEAEFEHFR